MTRVKALGRVQVINFGGELRFVWFIMGKKEFGWKFDLEKEFGFIRFLAGILGNGLPCILYITLELFEL